jgi:hypothetical protein
VFGSWNGRYTDNYPHSSPPGTVCGGEVVISRINSKRRGKDGSREIQQQREFVYDTLKMSI